ncbi:hypothetical protein GH714_011648 [Hevea brasiliensis]|uniref:Protein DA1-like domain-containing protein n=1 Tax=Hevea brasiliensis TaxID=3981 RepID=A0A6A6N232_HEVBR|nr:hypothetical protein GH714_011648 [Hevea brasiliensis]
MKWLSKIFKSGPSRGGGSGGGGRHPQHLGEENVVSWRPTSRSLDERSGIDKEKEEADRADALSQVEDWKRSGYRCRTDNDEEQARALHDRLNQVGYPRYAPPHAYYNIDYVVAAMARLVMAITWDAWGNFFIQSAFAVLTVVTQLLRMRDTRYYSLEDGRSLCLECMESAIMDTGDCQPLYHAIRDYYEGLNMKLDQQIPMLLVERQALNDAIVGEKNGYHHMPETRGLCLSEEQTVTSIQRRPRIGGTRLIGIRTQPQKLTRKSCEVTAILVLYGLPRLLTGAILAHELMHGWLRLKGYRNLNPEVEEGICQLLSHMWLESEVLPSKGMPSTSAASSSSSSSKKGGKSNVENKLGEFFMHQIANDASPAYGGGFRAANAAVNKYGLSRTLNHIRLTGHFPL